MTLFVDARIPIVFGVAPAAEDAVLTADPSWAGTHPKACACCVGRGGAAIALAKLFLARTRGERPWFVRVVVPDDPDGQVAMALDDPLVAGRFRRG